VSREKGGSDNSLRINYQQGESTDNTANGICILLVQVTDDKDLPVAESKM
jgi:hypothetical protein